MIDSELEVSVRARRLACVIDPLLALSSPYGALLAQRLAQVAEVWVTRSFWQALDASEFHRRDPLAFWSESERANLPASTVAEVRAALALWEEMRARTDLGHCRLHWLNDNITESALPEHVAPEQFARYERLHESLATRCNRSSDVGETLGFFGAMDALVLAATLGNARLLSFASSDARAGIVSTCAALGLALDTVPMADALARRERDRWRELLLDAAAAACVWTGLELALVHLALPVALPEPLPQEQRLPDALRVTIGELALDLEAEPPPEPTPDVWQHARVFSLRLVP
jgi:hypothetical protein